MPNSITESDTILVRLFLAILVIVACSHRASASAADDRVIATVYVTNWTSNSISRFELSSDGSLALQEVIPGPAGSANALGAALSPNKRSLYVAQWGSGSLSLFQVKRDGSLVAGGTVLAARPSPTDSAQVVVSPDGRRAYMTNFNAGAAGTLSIYDLSRTPHAIATIPTGGEGAAGAAISVDGRTLYIAHMTSGDVTAFRIGNDSRLTRLGSWAAGRGTFVVAVSPDSRRLWAANAISNDIAGFRISPGVDFRPTGRPLRSMATVRGESWSHLTGEPWTSHSTPMATGQERSPRFGWVGRARLNRSGNPCSPPAMGPKLSRSLATDAGSWWRISIKVSRKEA
jgi:DNA-binding beta-propeller fold protein YncE